MYFPKSKIIPDQYTNGGELAYKKSGTSYEGSYHILANGSVFTGKNPNDGVPQELVFTPAYNKPVGTQDNSFKISPTSLAIPKSLSGCFKDATSFNQNISGWSMLDIENISSIFDGATCFNQNLSTWNVVGITNASNAFDNSGLSPTNYTNLLIGWAGYGINLKSNVKTIEDSLNKVLQLNGVSFDWNDSQQSSAGVIAQDVEKVLPEIVRENATGYKSLNYNGLIGLLIEAVKEQNKTIEML
jgi:hypothetical protein